MRGWQGYTPEQRQEMLEAAVLSRQGDWADLEARLELALLAAE